MAETIVNSIIQTTIISSLEIWVILILKKNLFKKYTKKFNYYIWILVILRLIIPFRIPINVEWKFLQGFDINNIKIVSEINENKFDNIHTNLDDMEQYVISSEKSDKTSDIETSEINNGYEENDKTRTIDNIRILKSKFIIFNHKFRLYSKLICIWIFVAVSIFIFRFISYFRMKNIIFDLSYDIDDLEEMLNSNLTLKDIAYNQKILKIYNELQDEMGIAKDIQLRVCEDISIPFGIGIFEKHIVLPQIDYKEKELRWILKHELTHYKNNDLIYKFIITFLSIIYWFNPFIYIMNKEINNDCELFCDEHVLRDYDFKEKQDYALTIIKSLKNINKKSFAINLTTGLGSKEILKKRFDSMFSRKGKKGRVIGLFLAIICIISICSFSYKKKDTFAMNYSVLSKYLSEDIELYTISDTKCKGYYIQVKDPKRIKVAYTSGLNKYGQTVAEIAEENNAVAAVNGGGFKGSLDTLDSDNNGIPTGFIISDGKCIYDDTDRYEKNSTAQASKQEVFAMTEGGKLITGNFSREELEKLNVQEALSFGPALIINGKKREMNGDGGWGIAPRTAIGQREDGTIILLVLDGRSLESFGATLKDTQEVLYELGAVNAVNLDGGSSSTMYYNGTTINSSEGREVPTAVIVQ